MQDDDLSKSVVACKKEAEVIKTWINFLEDTWLLQCSHIETKDKQTLYFYLLSAVSRNTSCFAARPQQIIHWHFLGTNWRSMKITSRMWP